MSKTNNASTTVSGIGRIPILDISPVIDGGRWPAKAFEGEILPFSARVFREGHDSVAAEILLTSPTGSTSVHRMRAGAAGSDTWHTEAQTLEQGVYTFVVRAFADDFETWHHNAEIKVKAGIDTELMMLEGANLFNRAAAEKGRSKNGAALLSKIAGLLADTAVDAVDRLGLAEAPEVIKAVTDEPIRSLITLSKEYQIKSERKLAG
ncbi:MAG: hypothetical protein RL530_688, partial [Actinomycetota bacterium]